MPRPIPPPEKARWLILVTGLTASIPLYSVVVFVLASTEPAGAPAPLGMRIGIYGAAFALSLLALAAAPRVGTDPATALPFDAFLRRTLLSLAIAETVAILGLVLYFVGRNLGERDRSPAYGKMRKVFADRIASDTGKRPMLPSPAWFGST